MPDQKHWTEYLDRFVDRLRKRFSSEEQMGWVCSARDIHRILDRELGEFTMQMLRELTETKETPPSGPTEDPRA